MPATPLRWGILGVAAINDRLLPAFKASDHNTVAGIASRSPDKALAAADAGGIPTSFGSYEALLADPGIDAVYVPLPNHLHAEWAVKAADAGKHVLCEKPLAMTAAESATIVDHCRAKGVRLMDGFMWPHHPRTAKLRAALDAGVVGPVQKVVAAFSFKMPAFDPTVIRLRRESGGGGLMDVGCYCVAAIRWAMAADPVSVVAKATYFNDVDVDLTAILTFADGRTAHFDCGFSYPLRTHVEIVGTAGCVRIPNLWIPDDRASYEVLRQSSDFGNAVDVVETPGHDQMVCMLDEFAAAVREGRDCRPSPGEAVKTAHVLDAIAEAARTGREVAVGGAEG